MIIKNTKIAGLAVLALPLVTHAQYVATGSTKLGDIFNMLVRWLVALPRLLTFAAVALILFQVVRYIWSKRDGSAAETKKILGSLMTSIVALFIALSIWGIMAVLSSTFGIGIGDTLPEQHVPDVELGDVLPQ
jgi:hypothetical protein